MIILLELYKELLRVVFHLKGPCYFTYTRHSITPRRVVCVKYRPHNKEISYSFHGSGWVIGGIATTIGRLYRNSWASDLKLTDSSNIYKHVQKHRLIFCCFGCIVYSGKQVHTYSSGRVYEYDTEIIEELDNCNNNIDCIWRNSESWEGTNI